MSGVGHVAEETRYAGGILESAIAEAKYVHGKVESRVALLAAQAEASTAEFVGALSEHVKEVAVHYEAQTSCIVGSVLQQLEKEIEAVAVSTAVTSERNTSTAVDDVRKEVQAQLVQNRTDLEHAMKKPGKR